MSTRVIFITPERIRFFTTSLPKAPAPMTRHLASMTASKSIQPILLDRSRRSKS